MAILLLIVSKIREMSRDSSHIFDGDFVVDCKLKSAFLECLVKKIP